MSHLSVLPFLLCTFLATSALAATVAGTVVDPDGRPVPHAAVTLQGRISAVAAQHTDDDGRFLLTAPEPGRYRLTVTRPGFFADPIDVELSSTQQISVTVPLRISAVSESVVVSASHVERWRTTTADVTVIEEAELQARGLETVSAALQSVPGFEVASTGGPGALTSLFPRGGDSNFTLVLVDGVRLNGFGGGFDFGHLDVLGVERIEVVRGPQSAVHGADAIGGVVHVITRRGGRPRGSAVAETGAFGTHRAGAATAGSFGTLEWGSSLAYRTSDGYTGDTAAGERVTNDDYEALQGYASGAWRPAAGTVVRGLFRASSDERGFPGPFGSDPGDTFSGVDRISRGQNDGTAWTMAATQSWTSTVRQRVEVTRGVLDGDFASPFGTSHFSTRRTSFRTQADVALGARIGVSGGVEIHRERAGSTFIADEGGTGVPVERWLAGSFAEVRLEPAAPLTLTAGVRVERISRDSLAADPVGAARPFLPTDVVVSANPRVAASYRWRQGDDRSPGWMRVHATAGTGIRPPDAFEIAFTDNPDLEPERSRSFAAGVEQALLGGRLIAEVTGFVNRYDDLIEEVGRSLRDASRYRTANVANARARGWEVAGRARTTWGAAVRVAYTWLHSEVLSVDALPGVAPPPFRVGDPLIRRPRHAGTIDLELTRGRLTAFAHVRARGAVLDIDPSFGAFGGLYPAAGYTVTDAGGAVRLHRHVTLQVRASNLFNRAYEGVLGFPALGRRATVGVRVAAD